MTYAGNEKIVVIGTEHPRLGWTTVKCPFCHKKHYHGYAPDRYPGYRLSHCEDYKKRRSYYVVIQKKGENK